MLTTRHAIAAFGVALLGAGVLVVSTASASDLGNAVDSDGCEWGLGPTNTNWCTYGGNGVHIQAVYDPAGSTQYYLVADPNGSSAYAEAKCTDGLVALKGTIAGSMGPFYCKSYGAVGQVSVCGAKPVCSSKL